MFQVVKICGIWRNWRKKKDSCTAREYEVNLPHELNKEQRFELAKDFAKQLAEKYGIAVDVCMHEPNKKSDQRNFHAHILTTTRKITNDGLTENFLFLSCCKNTKK